MWNAQIIDLLSEHGPRTSISKMELLLNYGLHIQWAKERGYDPSMFRCSLSRCSSGGAEQCVKWPIHDLWLYPKGGS